MRGAKELVARQFTRFRLVAYLILTSRYTVCATWRYHLRANSAVGDLQQYM